MSILASVLPSPLISSAACPGLLSPPGHSFISAVRELCAKHVSYQRTDNLLYVLENIFFS